MSATHRVLDLIDTRKFSATITASEYTGEYLHNITAEAVRKVLADATDQAASTKTQTSAAEAAAAAIGLITDQSASAVSIAATAAAEALQELLNSINAQGKEHERNAAAAQRTLHAFETDRYGLPAQREPANIQESPEKNGGETVSGSVVSGNTEADGNAETGHPSGSSARNEPHQSGEDADDPSATGTDDPNAIQVHTQDQEALHKHPAEAPQEDAEEQDSEAEDEKAPEKTPDLLHLLPSELMEFTRDERGLPAPTAEEAQRFFANLRGGANPDCGHCPSNKTKKLPSSKDDQYYCNDCHSVFTIKTNTLLGGSKVTLYHWVQAIYLYASNPAGTTGESFAATLGTGATNSRRMLQSIRTAFSRGGDPVLNLIRPVIHKQRAQNGHANGKKCPPEGGMRGTNQPCPNCHAHGTKFDDEGQEICIMCDRPVTADKPDPATA